MTDVDDHVTAEDPIIGAVETGFTPPSAQGLRWPAIVLPPLVLTAVVIGFWYAVSYLVLVPRRRFLLRPPHEVVANGFLDRDAFSEILTALWSSAKVALIGLAIAIVLGVAVAVAMSQAKLVERAVFPYMVMLQAIPILAIVPLIGFWFGYGLNSRVIVCVIISIFPIIANTLFGLQSADASMHDLFTLHRVSRATRLRKLMFPNALPAIFTGLRISAGLSVIGAIVGDFFFGQGDAGIGQNLRKYANNLDGEELFTAVIMAALLGVAIFLAVNALERRVTGRWTNAGSR
jgi:NitT/TauT family transport system permease protein